MEAKELLEQHPKTTSLLREWWMRKVKEALDTSGISDEYKKMVEENWVPVDDVQIERSIDGNPHTLFEFFDENGIYVTQDVFIKDEAWYTCYIGNEKYPCNEFITRRKAERDIINDAFEMLEEKL